MSRRIVPWLAAAMGCATLLLLSGCPKPRFSAKVFVHNATERELFVEEETLGGDCDALFAAADGFLRQDDFSGQAQRVRLLPGRVSPLEGCLSTLSVGSLRTAIIWDPALKQRGFAADELPTDHSQFVQLVEKRGRLEFALKPGIRTLDVLPAGSPPTRSDCAEADVARVAVSRFNEPARGIVLDIQEHEGCFTLRLPHDPSADELDAGADDPSPSFDRIATVELCMPRELFPFAKGDELAVRGNVIERISGSYARLGVFTSPLPMMLRIAADSQAHEEPMSWSLSQCGLVRDPDGLAWQPYDMHLGGMPWPAGVPINVDGVTYYLARSMHPLIMPGGPFTDSWRYLDDRFEWLEVRR